MRFRRMRRPDWLSQSNVLLIGIGILTIGGFSFYEAHREYETTLHLWSSELGASVRYQSWALENSLQQSQDDARVLAEFSSTRQLLLAEPGIGKQSPARAALEHESLGMFEEYRKIYEYSAVYLLDDRARVALRAEKSNAWSRLVQSAKFKKLLASVIRNRRYAAELGQGVEQELTLLFMMPVFAGEPGAKLPTQPPIGVVVLVDPFARDLLPLLTARSVVTHTAQTVLLQVEGGAVEYASPHHSASTYASHNLETDTLRQTASSAVGTRSVFGRFVDDRGIGVLAALEKIDGINSVVACKVDYSEAFADFRRVVRIEMVTALSILTAFIAFVLMRNRRALARNMRDDLARQQYINQLLETKVAQRTSQLAEMNESLDQRIRERTAELEFANNELESANKELEAFSYSVSHDLRAPLRAVDGLTGIVLEDFGSELPQEGRKYLERIRDRGQQMGRLIDDLLAFSRLSRQPINGRRVDTAALVRSALEELNPQYHNRQIEFKVGTLPACYGDPALLKQVWVNLLSNAIKYSRGRTPAVVEVGCQHEAREDIYWVRDNGTGFDMAYAHKLFGVFQRLHREDEFEGTGVGLAIVQRVINRHHGRVWAEAEKDRGTTFRFSLERQDAA